MKTIPSENAYVAYMISNVNYESTFTEFKQAHDEFVSENVWSETDKILAYYALTKQMHKQMIEKVETRAAAQRKIKSIEANYAKRLK